MKALSLYIDKWYIVGAVIDDGGPHPLSLPNAEERVWLYFYNDLEANRVRYSESYRVHALANATNYYGDIFSLIPSSKEKSYKWYGSDKPMRTIFENAGIFTDLRGGSDESEKIPTYLAFSSDICFESQSIFMELLRENGFEIKEFVAHIENLAVEYANRRGLMASCKYILVANACNENIQYALYRQQEGLFVQVRVDKTLQGKGEDSRKYAIVEQVIDIMNAGSRLLSNDEERQKEHQYLSQFADGWLAKIDGGDAKPIPLGSICFSKQKNNFYPVSVLKSDIDKRTDATVDEITGEMVKIVDENGIQSHEISHVLLLGDMFDNGQFVHNLQKRLAISTGNFVHIHERELATVVSIYRELPDGLFDADEKEFEQNVEKEISQTAQGIRDRINNLRLSAEDAERRGEYDTALELFKEASSQTPADNYFKEKIRNLDSLIKENREKARRYKEYIAKAKTAYDIKNWDEAITQCSQALKVMPNSEEAKKLSMRIRNKKEQYAKLEEYLLKIGTLIEHKDYEGAKKEIDKVSSLGLKDTRLVSFNNEIKRIEDKRQKQIQEEEKALSSCLESHEYDEAIGHANALLEIDKEHSSVWNDKVMEIKQERTKEKERMERLALLKQRIDLAKASSDWSTVVSLCEEYLVLEKDAEIKGMKEQAEQILVLQQQQTLFDEAVREEYWQKVIDLDRDYPMLRHNSSNARIIKNARRLLSLGRKKKNTLTIEIPMGSGETVPDISGITQTKGKRHIPKPRTSNPTESVGKVETVKTEKPSTRTPTKKYPIPHHIADTNGASEADGTTDAIQTENASKRRNFPRPKRK